MDYYRAAGEKLIEAREGSFNGDPKGFYAWAEKTFWKKPTQIRTYVSLVITRDESSRSLNDFQRNSLKRNPQSEGRVYRPWTAPVDTVAERARDEQRRLAAREVLTRNQERDAERKLGLKLIDIGYKVLAPHLTRNEHRPWYYSC